MGLDVKPAIAMHGEGALAEVDFFCILENRIQLARNFAGWDNAIVSGHTHAETRGLLELLLHQLGACYTFREAGEVFNFSGHHQLATGHQVFAAGTARQHQWVQIGTGGIDGSSPAGWGRCR